MKKLVALLMAVALCIMSSVALAGTDSGAADRHPFNRNTVSMTTITPLHTSLSNPKTSAYAGHIYIRNYIYNGYGDPSLSNLFCAFKGATSGDPIGSKWMPSDGAYYINNSQLTAYYRYAAGCRANTDHALAEHGSHSTVMVSGYLHPNAKP